MKIRSLSGFAVRGRPRAGWGWSDILTHIGLYIIQYRPVEVDITQDITFSGPLLH